MLEPVREPFRAVAATIVPEAAGLAEPEWIELEALVAGALRDRPSMARQIRLFVRALNWLSVLRHGRTLARLSPEKRTRFLAKIQDSPIRLLRVGFWGLRTLVFLGYYGRAGVDIGYAASPRGWEAFR